jgi:very-short-patch-repair endonuclease
MAHVNGGLVTRAQALGLGPRHVVDDALNDGVLRGVHPGVYVTADVRLDRRLLRRAALAYLPDAALSHLDALDIWGFEAPAAPRAVPTGLPTTAAIHLTAAHGHRAIASSRLVLHRRRHFRPEPPLVVQRDGLRVVRLEQALLESWALLPTASRRAPLIAALRDRRTTASRLVAVLGQSPRLRGAADMSRLIGLVDAGCHSELEIWGHDRVFTDPRLPPSRRQHRVAVGDRNVFLDRYIPVERVGVELDGAAWHGRPEQRENDLRRDAALSAMGILVVRYSHRRLVADPDAIVDELREILAHRRVGLAG